MITTERICLNQNTRLQVSEAPTDCLLLGREPTHQLRLRACSSEQGCSASGSCQRRTVLKKEKCGQGRQQATPLALRVIIYVVLTKVPSKMLST